jgi:hypothetical protein
MLRVGRPFDVTRGKCNLAVALRAGRANPLVQRWSEAYTPRGYANKSPCEKESEVKHLVNWKSKLALGVLTALAMMFLTYALPRGGAMRDAALVQFPVTVGVWAIFVLLFVKLK